MDRTPSSPPQANQSLLINPAAMSTPRLVKDIQPGNVGSWPVWLTAVGNTLFFVADDGLNGDQLWRSDGTASGTKLVLSGRAFTEYPTNLTALGNTLYFSADDGFSGTELWKSNGTSAGTTRLTDINPGSGSSYPSFFTAVDNLLYFTTDYNSRRNLWRTDGTAAGTFSILNSGFVSSSSSDPSFAAAGSKLYISLNDEYNEL
jgi:ELWxxDGT repeat protein